MEEKLEKLIPTTTPRLNPVADEKDWYTDLQDQGKTDKELQGMLYITREHQLKNILLRERNRYKDDPKGFFLYQEFVANEALWADERSIIYKSWKELTGEDISDELDILNLPTQLQCIEGEVVNLFGLFLTLCPKGKAVILTAKNMLQVMLHIGLLGHGSWVKAVQKTSKFIKQVEKNDNYDREVKIFKNFATVETIDQTRALSVKQLNEFALREILDYFSLNLLYLLTPAKTLLERTAPLFENLGTNVVFLVSTETDGDLSKAKDTCLKIMRKINHQAELEYSLDEVFDFMPGDFSDEI